MSSREGYEICDKNAGFLTLRALFCSRFPKRPFDRLPEAVHVLLWVIAQIAIFPIEASQQRYRRCRIEADTELNFSSRVSPVMAERDGLHGIKAARLTLSRNAPQRTRVLLPQLDNRLKYVDIDCVLSL